MDQAKFQYAIQRKRERKKNPRSGQRNTLTLRTIGTPEY